MNRYIKIKSKILDTFWVETDDGNLIKIGDALVVPHDDFERMIHQLKSFFETVKSLEIVDNRLCKETSQ